jgi:hypothetical protein
VVGRLGIFCVYFLAGLGAGFALWGSRIDNLSEGLNRMLLEQESLRARLGSPAPDRSSDVLAEIASLSSELRVQAELLQQQSDAIGGLAGSKEQELRASLTRCGQTEVRLQTQLEQCLFAKSKIERGPAAASSEPQRGTGTMGAERTVELPQEVLRKLKP